MFPSDKITDYDTNVRELAMELARIKYPAGNYPSQEYENVFKPQAVMLMPKFAMIFEAGHDAGFEAGKDDEVWRPWDSADVLITRRGLLPKPENT